MVNRLPRLLLYGGTVVVVLGLGKVHAAYIAQPPYDFTGTFRFAWSLAYVALLCVTAYAVGLPDLPSTPRRALVAGVGATVAGALGISLVQLFAGDALLPRFVVFGSAILLVPWYVLCAGLATGGPPIKDRVLVVGRAVSLAGLRHELATSAERAATVVGVRSPDEVVGSDGTTELEDEVHRAGTTVLVLDHDAQAVPSVVAQAARLHAEGVQVRTLSLFYEEWLGKLPLAELEQVSLLFDIGEVHRRRYTRVKRLLDVALALPLLVLLLVVLPFVALGDLVANRGPLFYHQSRVGKQGTTFRIHKLRSMRPADPGASTAFTAPDDDRVTPFGRFLRVSHLDELPQVLNILRGDLSFVGPRPEQPHYVEQFARSLPYYQVRHLVRPGLTGWAQVKYHYGADEEDARQKLQYEFYYLRHQRLSLDLRILGRTVRSVVRGQGR